MTELERKVIKQFIGDETLMFYGCYVDDTLVVIQLEDLNRVHNALNNFDHNLKFTLDTYSWSFLHFLDIEIHTDGLGIYNKPTNTGQTPILQAFLHDAIKLHGSLILFTVLQLGSVH